MARRYEIVFAGSAVACGVLLDLGAQNTAGALWLVACAAFVAWVLS